MSEASASILVVDDEEVIRYTLQKKLSRLGYNVLSMEKAEDALYLIKNGEMVDLMLLARREGATYSGVMRRINFPGSPKEPLGMISERRMAQLVAISRLVMGTTVKAHCTHEPHSLSLVAGANLFFPEVGSSPRDGQADTGKGRGNSTERCGALLREMEWDPDLPSNCF